MEVRSADFNNQDHVDSDVIHAQNSRNIFREVSIPHSPKVNVKTVDENYLLALRDKKRKLRENLYGNISSHTSTITSSPISNERDVHSSYTSPILKSHPNPSNLIVSNPSSNEINKHNKKIADRKITYTPISAISSKFESRSVCTASGQPHATIESLPYFTIPFSTFIKSSNCSLIRGLSDSSFKRHLKPASNLKCNCGCGCSGCVDDEKLDKQTYQRSYT